MEYPGRRRVHHEEEVRRAVQGNGRPRSSERGAYAPGVGRKVPSPPEPDQRLEEEAPGTVLGAFRTKEQEGRRVQPAQEGEGRAL